MNSVCEGYAREAKGNILEFMKMMWCLGCMNTVVIFQLFDAQIKPVLLYASEVWGTVRLSVTESAHPFACNRLLGVTDRTPIYMVYGETGRFIASSYR